MDAVGRRRHFLGISRGRMAHQRASPAMEFAWAGRCRRFYRRLEPALVPAGKQFPGRGVNWTAVDSTGVDILAKVPVGTCRRPTGSILGHGGGLRTVGEIL